MLISCSQGHSDAENEMPLLHPAVQQQAFNPPGGYQSNAVTGNRIAPLLNLQGEPLVTGVPVKVPGKLIHPDSIKKPEVLPAGRPSVISIRQNTYKVPEDIPVFQVNTDSLKMVRLGGNSSAPALINSTGDRVSTGVPVPVSGMPVPTYHPQPLQALLPGRKDVAVVDMKYLDVQQGLNSSHILSALEDRDGNLWFATRGSGVSMYNGSTFTHYTEKEGLSSNFVHCIVQDKEGNIWFGTYGSGITRYDGRAFTHFTEKEGLSDNHIRSMLVDHHGNLWIGTWHGGVSRYDGKEMIHYTAREGFSNETVNSIFEDSWGTLWFGTNGQGVVMFDGKAFTHYTEKDGLSSNIILSVTEDHHGDLWFGTGGSGAVKFSHGNITVYQEKDGMCDNTVRAIMEDSHGNIWFATEHSGLCKLKDGFFTHYTEEQGLSDNEINAILEDSQGNLWICTEYGGVTIFNPRSFTHFTRQVGMRDDRIRCILEDRQGNIWYGPWNGGAAVYRDGNISYYSGREGFSDHVVNAIFEDSRGNIWFGTDGSGVIMYNGNSFTHISEAQGLSSKRMRCILEDSEGIMWFGTWGEGVTRYDGNTYTRYSEREGFSGNYLGTVVEDRKGNIWFGTNGRGVARFNGETFTYYTEKEGFSDNHVQTIVEDQQGYLWFGTYGGGVCVLDGDTLTYITEKEGLSNNIVQSVQEDKDGNIWISTEKGLSLIAPDPENGPVQTGSRVIRTFGLQDGLIGADFILNCVLYDREHRLWWGSSKSVTMLEMSSYKIAVEPPDVHLNNVIINDRFIDFNNLYQGEEPEITFDEVARFYGYPVHLELPYKNNHLTFHFSAIDWTAPHQIRYSFRIGGFNEDWSLPSTATTADYRKLPHGSYTFTVRAMGAAQRWSQAFEYPFIIRTPWYATWWAWILYTIAFLLVIYWIIRLRTAKLKRRHQILEAEIEQATHQIREQKEEIESQRDELMTINVELGKQKKELQQTVDNLKLTQSQLIQSEKMASLGLLTAGIAHEMNNPVNFIGGSVNPLRRDLDELFSLLEKYDQVLASHKLDQAISEVDALKKKMDFTYLTREIFSLLKGIEEGASRSSEIVKGLRCFSRMDEEKWQLYDIHEGIGSTLILLQNKIKNRIEIITVFGDLEPIECHPSKLNQVFLNVLTNSIQAIEGKGRILIQTVKSAIGVKIIIKDNGTGMTPEVKRRMFDPFFTTKEVGEGTGLGLSISYGIIEQHQGNIDVISEPGRGTEFIISLPLKQ